MGPSLPDLLIGCERNGCWPPTFPLYRSNPSFYYGWGDQTAPEVWCWPAMHRLRGGFRFVMGVTPFSIQSSWISLHQFHKAKNNSWMIRKTAFSSISGAFPSRFPAFWPCRVLLHVFHCSLQAQDLDLGFLAHPVGDPISGIRWAPTCHPQKKLPSYWSCMFTNLAS